MSWQPGAVISFLLGLAAGSFLNVVIFRLGHGSLRGRSRCLSCGKALAWRELVPLLSFAVQRARCRSCKAPLSWQYPAVELTTGLLFLLVFLRFTVWSPLGGFSPEVWFKTSGLWVFPFVALWWYYVSVFVAVAVYDMRTFTIPDVLVAAGGIGAFAGAVYEQTLRRVQPVLFPSSGVSFSGPEGMLFGSAPFGELGSVLLGVIVAAGFLGTLHFFSRGRAMGLGDVKLGIFIGLALGWPDTLVALLVSFVIGTIWSTVFIFFRKGGLRSIVPFGPFLALGTVITMLAGDTMLHAYFRIFPGFFFPA